MNELSPDASKIESIQASKEYQFARESVESLRDLKSSIVDVCDFVFDDSLSAQEQLALIDSSLDRSLLDTYIESYEDAAEKIMHCIYTLEENIDENPDAQELVDFLRSEIAELNKELTNFDYVDEYPELKVLIDLNAVLIVGIQTPWMVLNKEYRANYQKALETYVSEFSRIRRERLAQELGVEIEAAELREDLDINQKVQLLLKTVYKDVSWTGYRLRGGMWAEGSSGDMTEKMFLESNLADSLNVALREYLQKGYSVKPIVKMIDGYNGKDSLVPFSMYDISFEISNDVETQVVRPVDVEKFYHPLLHGRKGLEDKQPLEQMHDIDFKMQTILKEAPVWDGKLDSLKEIRININSFRDFHSDLMSVSSAVNKLKGLIDPGYLETVFDGWIPLDVDINAVNLAIVRLRESGNSELKDYALRAKSVIDKYDDYKVVFDLLSELKDKEFVDTDLKVQQVMSKAREVESSLLGSQAGGSSESDDVGDESGSVDDANREDESGTVDDSDLEDEGSGSDPGDEGLDDESNGEEDEEDYDESNGEEVEEDYDESNGEEDEEGYDDSEIRTDYGEQEYGGPDQDDEESYDHDDPELDDEESYDHDDPELDDEELLQISSVLSKNLKEESQKGFKNDLLDD